MAKADSYRQALSGLADWDAYLEKESGLPGPRGNLELAGVAADLASQAQIERWLALDSSRAPVNTPSEFLAFCGVLALGRLIVEGQSQWMPVLRARASDPRWRTREAVAMALQRVGKADMNRLLDEMERWCAGTWLEQRAAAAALAEPALLVDPAAIRRALAILDRITAAMQSCADRRDEDFRTLRQGMAYCWSVVVAALPGEGKAAMEKWLVCTDPDIRWMMRENLKKNRLVKMDAEWTHGWAKRLSS